MISIKHLVKPIFWGWVKLQNDDLSDNQSQYSHALAKTAFNEKDQPSFIIKSLFLQAIEQNGGTVDPSYSNRVTHVLVETQASDVCRLVSS